MLSRSANCSSPPASPDRKKAAACLSLKSVGQSCNGRGVTDPDLDNQMQRTHDASLKDNNHEND